MATSPNFNWPEPDNSDLVKNGALAIRTAVDAIDSSMADLKGGTTGQVLSKTSNTDMDFTWVAADDTNAIQNSIVDAKGDLIAASAADTPARLAVGNNGETLVANSSTSTGLAWAGNYAAGKNKILNSNCSIWQRGTSITVGAASYTYTADRFKVYSANTSTTVSRDTSAPTGFNYSLKLQRPNGNTGTNSLGLVQILESATTTDLKGQAITFSFYIKKGANYSGGNISATVLTGTGTDQGGDPYSFTGLAAPINDSSYSPTTSFVRVAYGATIPSNVNEIAIAISYTPTGTAGADDAIYVTGIQLEAGTVATAFQTATGTIQGELAACQRYYFRLGAGCSGIAAGVQFGYYLRATATSTTNLFGELSYPVTMRRTPTAIDFSTVGWIVSWGAGVNAISAITIYDGGNVVGSNPQSAVLQMTTTGAASGTSYPVLANNSTASFIGLSAEL